MRGMGPVEISAGDDPGDRRSYSRELSEESDGRLNMNEEKKYQHYETEEQRLEARREQKRKWARDHAEAIRENVRRWRSENPERAKELNAENWNKNRQKYNENRRKANKDKA